MAVIHVVFARAVEGRVPAISGVGGQRQRIDTTAVSQQSTISTLNEQVAEVTATGGNVWVAFGANPTAAVGSDFLVLDGQTRYFCHLPAGTKLAVRDV